MPNGSGGLDCINCTHLDINKGAIEGDCTIYNTVIERPGYSVCHEWAPKHGGISEQRIRELVNPLLRNKLYKISDMGSISPSKDFSPQSNSE